jgi:hypothetical protein
MRIELNLETGEQTEHEDAPVTWVEPVGATYQLTGSVTLSSWYELR